MNPFGNSKNHSMSDQQLFAMSLIISVVLLFVCSKNSLIYPMNDYIDVNVFMSVTNSMFHGMVLYKDIFEHKGPFLYLIYGIAHILGNSYFTLYLFECLANALFVYFGTKTILLYDNEATRFRTFQYALCQGFCLVTSTTFMFGGTVEELYLWVSGVGLYVTLRCLRHEQYYTNKELVIIGLLCGALFWTKFSLLGFYTGLVLYVLGWNIAQRKIARLCETIALFLGGFTIASIPTVLYCLLTQSFWDMVNVYFIGNIWGNVATSSPMAHLYALMNIIYKDVAVTLLILFGAIYVLKNESGSIKHLLLTTIIPTFLASCCLKVFWTYYPMPMLIFIPLGIVACKEMKIKREYIIGFAALVVMLHLFASVEFGVYSPTIGNCANLDWVKEYIRVLVKAVIIILLLCVITRNCKKIENTKHELMKCTCILSLCVLAGLGVRDPLFFTIDQELPQIRFAEVIKQVDRANILIYGSYDYGFFLNSNTWPQVKHFCNLNLDNDEFKLEQNDYIQNEVVDFIITREKNEKLVRNTSYKLVDTSSLYNYNGYSNCFYLYKKSVQ